MYRIAVLAEQEAERQRYAERALFDPQIEAVKKELLRLAERKGRNDRQFTIKRKSQTTL